MTKRRRPRREREPLHVHEVIELGFVLLLFVGGFGLAVFQVLKG